MSVREENADDHVEIEIRSWSARSLAAELAGFGRWVEVLDPVEVREELARIGDELQGAVRRSNPGAM